MTDRTPTQVLANGAIRYAVYDGQGNFLRYEYLLPADEPTDPGTLLNKSTLLTDATAAKFDKGSSAVPDEILSALGDFVNFSAAHIAVGSYVGTGTHGSDSRNSLSFDFKPDVILIPDNKMYTSLDALNATHQITPNIAIRGQTYGFNYFKNSSGVSQETIVQFFDNSIKWYSPVSAVHQLNIQGTNYPYIVIGGLL